MAIEKLEYENDHTHQDLLNIPVDHVVIDFHTTFLTQKVRWMQNEMEDGGMSKFVPYTQQEIIYMINSRYGKDMEK